MAKSQFDGAGRAAIVMVVGHVAIMSAMVFLHDSVLTPNAHRDNLLSVWLLVNWLLLGVSRFVETGTSTLYEMLWGCNMAQLLGVVALQTGRLSLLGASFVMVISDQLCWWIDLVAWLYRRKMLVGVAKYLFAPDTPLTKRITSTHHLWFLPLCFWAFLRAGSGIPAMSWKLSVPLVIMLPLYCRFTTPKTWDHPKMEKPIYINCNMAFEVWKDLKIGFLSMCDKKPWFVYLAFATGLGNATNWVLYRLFDAITPL